MSIKYKKILFFILIVSFSSSTLCLEEREVEEKTAEKILFEGCLDIFTETYQEIVSVTAIYFIQDTTVDDETLEVKVIKEVGQGCCKLIVELARYSKVVLLSSRSLKEKVRRACAVGGVCFVVHRFINSLAEKRKNLQSNKTVSK